MHVGCHYGLGFRFRGSKSQTKQTFRALFVLQPAAKKDVLAGLGEHSDKAHAIARPY